MKTLFLYTTAGCHLCEEAQSMVTPLMASYGLVLEAVEIANSDILLQRYGARIPVLKIESESGELGWPFNQAQVIAFIKGQTPDDE